MHRASEYASHPLGNVAGRRLPDGNLIRRSASDDRSVNWLAATNPIAASSRGSHLTADRRSVAVPLARWRGHRHDRSLENCDRPESGAIPQNRAARFGRERGSGHVVQMRAIHRRGQAPPLATNRHDQPRSAHRKTPSGRTRCPRRWPTRAARRGNPMISSCQLGDLDDARGGRDAGSVKQKQHVGAGGRDVAVGGQLHG